MHWENASESRGESKPIVPIKFYKEQGVWNKQMDDLQARLLAQ